MFVELLKPHFYFTFVLPHHFVNLLDINFIGLVNVKKIGFNTANRTSITWSQIIVYLLDKKVIRHLIEIQAWTRTGIHYLWWYWLNRAFNRWFLICFLGILFFIMFYWFFNFFNFILILLFYLKTTLEIPIYCVTLRYSLAFFILLYNVWRFLYIWFWVMLFVNIWYFFFRNLIRLL